MIVVERSRIVGVHACRRAACHSATPRVLLPILSVIFISKGIAYNGQVGRDRCDAADVHSARHADYRLGALILKFSFVSPLVCVSLFRVWYPRMLYPFVPAHGPSCRRADPSHAVTTSTRCIIRPALRKF